MREMGNKLFSTDIHLIVGYLKDNFQFSVLHQTIMKSISFFKERKDLQIPTVKQEISR
jgi:hypothetical protein